MAVTTRPHVAPTLNGVEIRLCSSVCDPIGMVVATFTFIRGAYPASRDRGSTVVNVLCYKSEGRWFDPSWFQWIFFIDIKSFRSHYGPGVDSASDRNEYQEYFLEVKAASA